MSSNLNQLKDSLKHIAGLIQEKNEIGSQYYSLFLEEPELALELIDIISALKDDASDEEDYYSACVFSLDICVAQLQAAAETGSKLASKALHQLMGKIAGAIRKAKQSLSFWLPILNAFYEVHVELTDDLKDAYLDLASNEDLSPQEEEDHLNSIREMIEELSDLSTFDIAENFFAQSYAMPADFFMDLIIDLYSIEEGQDIALLSLMHPKQEVREVVVATIELLIENITLSSISLSRLQMIKAWYPLSYQAQFDRWIKIQRKKGVVFANPSKPSKILIKASEIDGSGAQGIFIDIKTNKSHRLCGLLFRQESGIKDAWITQEVQAEDVSKYYGEAFDSSVTLRKVDLAYLKLATRHFLALTLQQNRMPDLHLLEIQETLGVYFHPELLDIPQQMNELSIQINPFTLDEMNISLKRSKRWSTSKSFVESWFVENSHVDKLVNRCCNFVQSLKVCDLEKAMSDVFSQELETQREKWLDHFLWTALWARANAAKNERLWQDSFFIAYSIYTNIPLTAIPIMHEICRRTVLNSIETMQDRRTYLNRE